MVRKSTNFVRCWCVELNGIDGAPKVLSPYALFNLSPYCAAADEPAASPRQLAPKNQNLQGRCSPASPALRPAVFHKSLPSVCTIDNGLYTLAHFRGITGKPLWRRLASSQSSDAASYYRHFLSADECWLDRKRRGRRV